MNTADWIERARDTLHLWRRFGQASTERGFLEPVDSITEATASLLESSPASSVFKTAGPFRLRLPSESLRLEMEQFHKDTIEISGIPAFSSGIVIPRIGNPWPGQGGTYAGIVRSRFSSHNDHHLILGPEYNGAIAWNEAILWASTLTHPRLKDYVLPSPRELAIGIANVPEAFQKRVYWTGDSCSVAGSLGGALPSAWTCNASNGLENYYGVKDAFCARAVRRIPIA